MCASLRYLGKCASKSCCQGNRTHSSRLVFRGVALVELCARIHPELGVACGGDDDGILQARGAAEPRQLRASESRVFDGGVCLYARAMEFTST